MIPKKSSRWPDRLGWVVAAVASSFIAFTLSTAPPRPVDRMEVLAGQLRCPTCQTVSVAESPSETARAMREIIVQQIAAGRSDDEIIAFFVDRYGAWILLDPPRTGAGLLLWLIPPAVLGVGVVMALLRKRRSGADVVRFRNP